MQSAPFDDVRGHIKMTTELQPESALQQKVAGPGPAEVEVRLGLAARALAHIITDGGDNGALAQVLADIFPSATTIRRASSLDLSLGWDPLRAKTARDARFRCPAICMQLKDIAFARMTSCGPALFRRPPLGQSRLVLLMQWMTPKSASLLTAGWVSGPTVDCFCSLAVYSHTVKSLPHSSPSQTVPLRFKSASTAAIAASTSIPMRTSRICNCSGGTRPTPWQLSVGLCRAWMTPMELRGAQLHCSWASAEATTRELPSSLCTIKVPACTRCLKTTPLGHLCQHTSTYTWS